MSDLLSRVTDCLSLSASKISSKLKSIFPRKVKLSPEVLQDLEEALISSDMGVETSASLIKSLPKSGEYDINDLKAHLLKELVLILRPLASPIFLHPSDIPTVIVMCGVNGNGKTTTIGKLAYSYSTQGKQVVIAAADTFRAAAEDQIAVWADRVGCELVRGKAGADPASVVFKAMAHCIEQKREVLIVDTAGRLPNQVNFMKELEKITIMPKKHNASAPHNILLVLDATTGQNALVQIEQFTKAVGITGLIVTKLDSSAKGGVIVSIAHRYPNVKIHSIGFGEGVKDLKPFDPEEFAKNILGC